MGRDHGHPYVLSTTVLSDLCLLHQGRVLWKHFFYYSNCCNRIRRSSIHSNGGCGISKSVCYSERNSLHRTLKMALHIVNLDVKYTTVPHFSYKINTTTDKTDYTHTEIDRAISERLCIDIPIINNYFPASDVQFSLRAASTSHNISTIPSNCVHTR